MLEHDFAKLYSAARAQLGKETNNAFIPEVMAAILADTVGTYTGQPVSAEFFSNAFTIRESQLHPDVGDFLMQIGQRPDIIPLIFTQGQVFDRGEQGDMNNYGFQNRKVHLAGIPWYLGADALARVAAAGLPLVHGGCEKTCTPVMVPIFEVAQQFGYSINYFDDRICHLEELHEAAHTYGVLAQLWWINRRQQSEYSPSRCDMTEIHHLGMVDVDCLANSVTLLDYDETLGNRQAMHNHLYTRAWQAAQPL